MYDTMYSIITGVNDDGSYQVSLIPEENDYVFRSLVRDRITSYTDELLTDKILGTERHIPQSLLLNNILSAKKYQNVLFIPSFRNNLFPRLLDASYILNVPNVNYHMMPCTNKYYELPPNIWVAYPEGHTSLYHDLMDGFGVNFCMSNGMYTMGDSTYEVTAPDGVEFDCVYLAGHPMPSDDTYFNAEDIKNDFAPYCTPDFDLHDVRRRSLYKEEYQRGNPYLDDVEAPPRIVGETKDMTDVFSYVLENTLRSDFHGDTRLTEMFTGRKMLPHFQKSYKVY
jgi:hypothetical protein